MHKKHLSSSSSNQVRNTHNMAPINQDDRRRMVAEAAYFRAEHHAFRSDDINDDWYQAEAEIDAMLTKMKDHQITLRDNGGEYDIS